MATLEEIMPSMLNEFRSIFQGWKKCNREKKDEYCPRIPGYVDSFLNSYNSLKDLGYSDNAIKLEIEKRYPSTSTTRWTDRTTDPKTKGTLTVWECFYNGIGNRNPLGYEPAVPEEPKAAIPFIDRGFVTPSSAKPGAPVMVEATMTNQGDVDVDWTWNFEIIGRGGEHKPIMINAGETTTQSQGWDIPKDFAPGKYAVSIYLADIYKTFPEALEVIEEVPPEPPVPPEEPEEETIIDWIKRFWEGTPSERRAMVLPGFVTPIVDKIFDIFGYKYPYLTPEGEFIEPMIILFPLTTDVIVKTAAPKLSSTAVKELSTIIRNQGYKGINRLATTAPKKLVSLFKGLTDEQYNVFMELADKSSAGRMARLAIAKVVGRDLFATAGQLGIWGKIASGWKWWVGLIAGIMGTGFITTWTAKEAVKEALEFPFYLEIKAGHFKLAAEHLGGLNLAI